MRDANIKYSNARVSELPGLLPMDRDPREEVGAYFDFAFRFEREGFKGLPVEPFRETLAAELACPAEASPEPLNACSLYSPYTKPWRHKLGGEYFGRIDPARFELQVCQRVYGEESVCFHHTVLMGGTADMDRILAAIEKVYENANELM